MPIEGPVDDLEEAVERLRQCPSTALRRARTHHRRALESLRNGGYSALSEATRDRLADRLRRNLDALNRALDTAPSSESSEEPEANAPSRSTESSSSLSARLRSFLRGLW
jgi:uncharacterized membrane protein YccC